MILGSQCHSLHGNATIMYYMICKILSDTTRNKVQYMNCAFIAEYVSLIAPYLGK